MQEWAVVVHKNDLIMACAAGLHLKTDSAPEFGYSITDNASLMEQKNPLRLTKQNLNQMIFVIIFLGFGYSPANLI